MRVTRKSAVVAGGALLLVGAGAGIARATIPSDNTLTACYAKAGGAVRLVDPAVACKSSEKRIAWNVRGPQGIPGTAGVNGTNGTDGTDGTDGVDGVSGYQVVTKDFDQVEEFGGGSITTILLEVSCPAGKVAIGGGASGTLHDANSTLGQADLSESHPSTFDSATWVVGMSTLNGSTLAQGQGISGRLYAVCATAG